MRASLLFLLIAFTAFSQKKPITLQPLELTGAPPVAAGNPVAWSPDGERFLFLRGQQMMVYTAATQTSKELVDLSKLPDAKVDVVNTPQPFEWQNRRVSERPVQWGAGDRILYARGGELFVIDAN